MSGSDNKSFIPFLGNLNDRSVQIKLVILLSLLTIIVTVIASLVVFFLSIEGEEQTKVPDLVGQELAKAVISLQEKSLNPRVHLHFSANPEDKGKVLSQDPEPGALVKANSTVALNVSRGAVIDRVEDYVGWTLNDLEIHLQTLFTTYGPLLHIKQPVIRVHDEAEPGTIIEQKPEPGTRISGVTELELVVSKGPEPELEIVDSYLGKPFEEARKKLVSRNIPFVFFSRESEPGEKPGTVVRQTPMPGELVEPGTVRELEMTIPENIPEGQVFGIIKRELPIYPILVELKLESISLGGKREQLLSMLHPGGQISIPYIAEENTMLILSVFQKEIIRYTVKPKQEPQDDEGGQGEVQSSTDEQTETDNRAAEE